MGTSSGKKLLTSAEFIALAARGLLGNQPRLELIRGEVLAMAPIGARHAGCVTLLQTLLGEALRGRALVRNQNPLWLSWIDLPQPDLLVVAPRADFYYAEHPRPQDGRLAIEVVETSLRFDRGVKTPLYARAGVVETWIVDLVGEVVEVHRAPTPRGYSRVELLRAGQRVSLQAFPDVSIDVARLFDPASGSSSAL